MSDGINAAKQERQISKAKERIDKSISELHQSVEQVRNVFAPILRNVPTTAPGLAPKEPAGAGCDFENMIESASRGILQAASDLQEFCQRSAV